MADATVTAAAAFAEVFFVVVVVVPTTKRIVFLLRKVLRRVEGCLSCSRNTRLEIGVSRRAYSARRALLRSVTAAASRTNFRVSGGSFRQKLSAPAPAFFRTNLKLDQAPGFLVKCEVAFSFRWVSRQVVHLSIRRPIHQSPIHQSLSSRRPPLI